MRFLQQSENRAGEYRIPERDSSSTGKLALPNGTIVDYTRYVNRVGYALDPRSYTKEQWEAAGFELVCKQTGLPEDEVKKVLSVLNLYSPYKGIRGQIYTKLVSDKTTDVMRSMWFKDFKQDSYRAITRQAWCGEIVGRCRKWTGIYCPGRTWGNEWESGYDYDPPCLEQAVNQNLYQVRNTDNGDIYMVHPLDIQVVSNG